MYIDRMRKKGPPKRPGQGILMPLAGTDIMVNSGKMTQDQAYTMAQSKLPPHMRKPPAKKPPSRPI